MSDIISSDIYNIAETILEIEKKFVTDSSEDILLLSSYGNMGLQFTKFFKNSVIMASEWGNENLLLKSKFDSTILEKAIEYQIKDINATPATMSIMIGFVESELLSAMTNDSLIISRNCLFEIGSYNFHFDHDLLIETLKISTNEYVYTARYIINEYSPNFTNTSNPYLPSPFRLTVNNDTFIFVKCDIVQTTINFSDTSIISNNILENKIVDFDYDDQLAGFEVLVTPSSGDAFYLTHVYEGMPVNDNLYCYYNYLDSNTIRIKFDTDSYNPSNGDMITIKTHTTNGSDGNFTYTIDVTNTLDDETDSIDYKGLSCLIKMIGDSVGGKDKKTTTELKAILPKEALARGIIATEADLDTYLNDLDSDNKLISKKKRHNQIERLYYTYFLAKDSNGNVVPTNTIDMKVYDIDFNTVNNKITIDANSRIVLNQISNYGYIQPNQKDSDNFVYSSPFTTIINKDLLSISYYLNVLNNSYTFNYDYINNNSSAQFVASKMKIIRNFLVDSKFRITLTMTQSSNAELSLITIDNNGKITASNIYPVLVMKSDSSTQNYYIYGNITSYDPSTYSYTVEFVFDSDNTMNEDNQVLIKDLYLGKGTTKSNIYMDMEVDMSIYVYTNLGNNYGSNTIVPTYYNDGYTLSNIYTTEDKVNLYYNYSDIIDTGVTIAKENNKIVYILKSIPMIRRSYIQDEDRCNYLIDAINYRKYYLEEALETIESGFGIDFKFYNTYGPAQTFYIGYDGSTSLDKINLSLIFLAKLKTGVDASILDTIKTTIQLAIEDLNDIAVSLHMVNLCNTIMDTYNSSLDFFDFEGINNYSALYKYIIKKNNSNIIDQIPEFLCMNLSDDITPDITINTI